MSPNSTPNQMIKTKTESRGIYEGYYQGSLTVMGRPFSIGRPNGAKSRVFCVVCYCTCGNIVCRKVESIRNNNLLSCGCRNAKPDRPQNSRKRLAADPAVEPYHPEYKTGDTAGIQAYMLSLCMNQGLASYASYFVIGKIVHSKPKPLGIFQWVLRVIEADDLRLMVDSHFAVRKYPGHMTTKAIRSLQKRHRPIAARVSELLYENRYLIEKFSKVDWKNLEWERLVDNFGLLPASASWFMIHTDPDAERVFIDQEILDWHLNTPLEASSMNSNYSSVPTTKARYLTLESAIRRKQRVLFPGASPAQAERVIRLHSQNDIAPCDGEPDTQSGLIT